jgi:precorrin-3B synthase
MQTGDGLLVRLNPIAGGQGAEGLSPDALIGLCESARRHGNGIVEVTARGSIQIRGLTPSSARRLAEEVDALGIAVRTGVPVETSPLAGLDPDEIADPRPLAEAIRAGIDRAGLAARLGPKVSVIVDGGGRFGLDSVPADVRLVAERGDGAAAWHLAVGGTAETARPLGTVSDVAACGAAVAVLESIAGLGRGGRGRDIDPSVLDEIIGNLESPRPVPPPTVLPDISPSGGEISSFADHPPSSTRREIGSFGAAASPSPLRGGSASEQSEAAFVNRGGGRGGIGHCLDHPHPASQASLRSTWLRDPPLKGEGKVALGIFPLTNAAHTLAIALPFGSMPAEKLSHFAQDAKDLGAAEIRPAPHRILLVLGLTEQAAKNLQAAARRLGFVIDHADPRTSIAACPGAPACASGRIATRAIAEELAAQNPDFLDGSFTLHVSGCAKGCAHPAAATLALVGGENGAGLVVDGTARAAPTGYRASDDAGRGLASLAALVRAERKHGERTAACLARLGTARIATAFEQE